MPNFMISFGGTVFLDSLVRIRGKYYSHKDFICNIDSLHIYGKKEIYLSQCEAEIPLFGPGVSGLPPQVLIHEEGHRVPKDFSAEHAEAILLFL